MGDVLTKLSKYPVRTCVSLTGPRLIVARDIAHAKLLEQLKAGKGLPDYFKKHPIYYAGPAKTPEASFLKSISVFTNRALSDKINVWVYTTSLCSHTMCIIIIILKCIIES